MKTHDTKELTFSCGFLSTWNFKSQTFKTEFNKLKIKVKINNYIIYIKQLQELRLLLIKTTIVVY